MLSYATLPLNLQFGLFCLFIFLCSGIYYSLFWVIDKHLKKKKRGKYKPLNNPEESTNDKPET